MLLALKAPSNNCWLERRDPFLCVGLARQTSNIFKLVSRPKSGFVVPPTNLANYFVGGVQQKFPRKVGDPSVWNWKRGQVIKQVFTYFFQFVFPNTLKKNSSSSKNNFWNNSIIYIYYWTVIMFLVNWFYGVLSSLGEEKDAYQYNNIDPSPHF
jgi:hypothetical protein